VPGDATAKSNHKATNARARPPKVTNPIFAGLPGLDWLLYGYFLSIALEKSAKVRKRTKAQVLKRVKKAFYEAKTALSRGLRGWW
jgi:hypothetical protein